MKNKKIIILTVIIVVIFLVIGVTYAFFTYSTIGSTSNQLIVGDI